MLGNFTIKRSVIKSNEFSSVNWAIRLSLLLATIDCGFSFLLISSSYLLSIISEETSRFIVSVSLDPELELDEF